jgi:outer membrane receptor protein involved in Fe transport
MVQPTVLNPQYGNPTLPPIEAAQYSVGLERRLTDKLTIDATAYLVYRYDEPVPVPGPTVFEPTGEQRSYGLELILKHEFTERFYGWIAYTLSRSEQNSVSVGAPDTGGEGNIIPPASWTPTAFDQTHNFILVASYKLQAWRLGTRFRVVTGSPATVFEEGYYDADTGQYACRQAPLNSVRQPTFNQLDVRVERTWTFNAWMFSAYLDVQNVYNALNPEATVYDYRCRNSDPIRGVPILPVLGLRGLF